MIIYIFLKNFLYIILTQILVVIHTKPWDQVWGQEGTLRFKSLPMTLREQVPWRKDLFGSHLNMDIGDTDTSVEKKCHFFLYAETHIGEQ